MKHNYTKFLAGALVAISAMLSPVGVSAEQGVVVIAKDGSQTEMTLANVERIDIGESGITLRHSGGEPSEIAYTDLDRVLIGAEVNGVKDLVADGGIAVWPTRVTSTVNVTGITPGTAVSVHSIGGALVATATAGDDTASVDLSSAAPGVYIVTIGKHSVKIIKE